LGKESTRRLARTAKGVTSKEGKVRPELACPGFGKKVRGFGERGSERLGKQCPIQEKEENVKTCTRCY
jgi:hypothetical protein